MRTALSISSLFLAVILAFNVRLGTFTFDPDGPLYLSADANEGRSVRIYSCASGLPPVLFGSMPQQSSVFVDGEMYRSYFAETGLRVVTIPPGDGAPSLTIFNLSRDPNAPRRLRELIDSTPINSALALTSFRTIQPKGRGREERRDHLTKTLREIGTQTDPTNDNLVSWAILTLKRPQGWVPLSEIYSRTKGMSISYNLDDDRSVYDEVEPFLRVDETRQLSLLKVFDQVVESAQSNRVVLATVSGRARQSLLMPLENGARAKWRYVKLEDSPFFECMLGIPSDAYAYVPGARCSLVINGDVIASRTLGRDVSTGDSWQEWQVDLAAYSNRWVSVELRAEPLAETLPTSVFWGVPSFTHHPTGRKPKLGFERVMGNLDLNSDGVVGRPEVDRFMRRQDANRDGFVTADEAQWKKSIPYADRDGDGKASYAELDGVFELMEDPPR